MSLEFLPSGVFLLFDALLLLFRFLLIPSFLSYFSLDFWALILNIVVSKVLVRFLVSDVSKVFELLKSLKRQQDVFCPKGLQGFGLSFGRFLPVFVSLSFAENDCILSGFSQSSAVCGSTDVCGISLMGRREVMASLYSGFGGIALGMCSTFKISASKRDMCAVCEVVDTITVIEVDAAIFCRLLCVHFSRASGGPHS